MVTGFLGDEKMEHLIIVIISLSIITLLWFILKIDLKIAIW